MEKICTDLKAQYQELDNVVSDLNEEIWDYESHFMDGLSLIKSPILLNSTKRHCLPLKTQSVLKTGPKI